jgi:arylsulfatase A-like enzyme
MIRWPGHIKPGSVANEIVSAHDWFPTLLAAAGDSDIKDKLLKGMDAGGKTFKVHSTATTSFPISPAKQEKSPRAGSSTSTTTATSSPCASRTGRSSSWSSAPRHAASVGRAVHGAAAAEDVRPAADPYERPTSPRTPTTTGS